MEKTADPAWTLKGWNRALESVNLNDAKLATDALFRGDGEWKGYTDFPAAVQRWLRSVGQYSSTPCLRDDFDCEHCRDFGLRRIMSPRALESIRAWPTSSKIDPNAKDVSLRQLATELRTSCSVACECSAGNRWADPRDRHSWGRLPRFHSGMVPVAGAAPTDEEIFELVGRERKYRDLVNQNESTPPTPHQKSPPNSHVISRKNGGETKSVENETPPLKRTRRRSKGEF